ncbi:RTA1-domain-containing protein [Mollisia scopiformis]|uniref:RTA1-domain-containing protein n=1 Tax=Mollisia scopiformis TaxID=149040 RepID=A0A194WY13_MOLSC|nr:RTA1-domain-containing protein [Mollisia scopiformis]KUJ12579.1 RTA1-domain-containing protein [Mollisia scopiformis]
MPISDFKYYHYDPTLVGAIIFIVLFIATTSLHSYQLLRTRIWFMIPFVVGGLFEWIGYVGRAVSSQQSPNWTLGPYIVQVLLLLVAPALFAASIYMELGRIILLVDGEAHSWIKKRWLTKIFVAGDILSFLLQAGGGGIQSSGKASSVTTGSHIITGGLVIQLLFFGFFIIVAVHFDRAIHKNPTPRSQSPHVPWRKHLIALYVASLLIMIRSIFRVVEYVQGFDGYILSHEVFLYLFDSVLMFAVMVIFNVVHPSEVNALMRGGNAVKNGWQMERIEGHFERVARGDSGDTLA